MKKENLEILKELAETRDCSIHWRSEYNIALDEAIRELEYKIKDEIICNLTWIVNKVSETIVYDDWNNEFKLRENEKSFKMFYEELQKNIDFAKLTIEEAKVLRFKRWSEEQPNLWLFPLWLVPIIPEGLEVISISGKKYRYEKEKADNDIRFGCVAYGIEIKESENR